MFSHPADRDAYLAVQRARAERAVAMGILLGHGIRALWGLPSAAVAGAARAARRIGHWHRRHRAMQALSALDSRTLKDIGLYRGDIFTVADGIALGLDPRSGKVPQAPAKVIQLTRPSAAAAPSRRAA